MDILAFLNENDRVPFDNRYKTQEYCFFLGVMILYNSN